MLSPATTALLASLIGLFAGPVVWHWADRQGAATHVNAARGLMNGAVMTFVGGLLLLHLLPHALEHGVVSVLCGITLGALAPWLLHRRSPQASRMFGWVAMAVLTLHATFDGTALAWIGSDTVGAMGLAIAAHRLPVGLAVAQQLGPHSPRTWQVLSVISAATLFGFGAGTTLPAHAHGAAVALIEGLVLGGLGHVLVAPVFHRSSGPGQQPGHRWSVAGAVAGAVLLGGFQLVG